MNKEHNDVIKCRVCDGNFFEDPLLSYSNMPKAAQNFPDKNNLSLDRGSDLNVHQCRECGLIQLSNKPVEYYREVIRAAGISNEMKEFRTKQFSNFVNSLGLRNKKILEVGCGRGEYLSVMNDLDVNAFGLEYSKDSVDLCRGIGLSVQEGYLENSEFILDDALFDGFFILNFLEHLPNINEALQAMQANIVEEGVGLIEVPNFDMILEKNLFSEFIGDHLFYFTNETLERTLNLNGFEVIDKAVVWYDYVISVHVKKTKKKRHFLGEIEKVDIDHFVQHQQKITDNLFGYLNSLDEGEIAIWGAGHQSLAIIALTNIQDRISYLIDSADFKQNKFTPATHIPILSPDILKDKQPEAIIIMAASYSDEVARIILSNNENQSKVSILREDGLEIIR